MVHNMLYLLAVMLQVVSGSEERKVKVNLRSGGKVKCITYGLGGVIMFNVVRGTQSISENITLLKGKKASFENCVKDGSIVGIMLFASRYMRYDRDSNESKNLYQNLVFSLMWLLESKDKDGSEESGIYKELTKEGMIEGRIIGELFTVFRETFGMGFKDGQIKLREDNKDIKIPTKELVIEPHVLIRLENFECEIDNTLKFFNDQKYFDSIEAKRTILTLQEVQLISTFNLVKLTLGLHESKHLDVILGSKVLKKSLKVLNLEVWCVITENHFKKLSTFPLKELYIINRDPKHKVIEYQCIYGNNCELQKNVEALHLSKFEIKNEENIKILAQSYSLTKFTFDCRDFLTVYTLFYHNRLSHDNRFVKTLKEITILLGDFIPTEKLGSNTCSELRSNRISRPLDLIVKNEEFKENLEKLSIYITKTSRGNGYESVRNISLLSEFKKLNEIYLGNLNRSLDKIFVRGSIISKTLKSLTLHFDISYTLTLNDLEVIAYLKVLKKLIIRCNLVGKINLEEGRTVFDHPEDLEDLQFCYIDNTEGRHTSFQRLKDFPLKTLVCGILIQPSHLSYILNGGGKATVLSYHLINLTLFSIYLNRDDFVALLSCSNLRKLHLCDCKVTGDISEINSSEFNISLDELCIKELKLTDVVSVIKLFKDKFKKLVIAEDENLTIQDIETIISLLDEGVIIEIIPKVIIVESSQTPSYDPNKIHTFVSSYDPFYGITRFGIRAFWAFSS